MVVQAYEYEKEHLLPKEDALKKQADELDDNGEGASSSAAAKKQKTEHGPQQQAHVRTKVSYAPLRGFFATTKSTMKTPMFNRLDAELRERRRKMMQERGWNVTAEE